MLSPNLSPRLDELGIVPSPFGTERQRYYEALQMLTGGGRKDEAIELIELAVGIKDFDDMDTQLQTLQHHSYSKNGPYCGEVLFSKSPEVRKIAHAVFDEDSRELDVATRNIGRHICAQCVHLTQCNEKIE